MRLYDIPSPLLCLITALLARPVTAGLIPNLFFDDNQLPHLEDQQDVRKRCANQCGYYGQLCCPADATCYTDYNDQAQCSYGPATTQGQAADGTWVYYTTTYVRTNLETVTITSSSFCPATTVVTLTVGCSASLQETQCGNRCCPAGQYCGSGNTCMDTGGGGSSNYYSTQYVTSTVGNTNTLTAPARVTSYGTVTLTSTGSVSTVPYSTPVSTAGIIQGAQSTTTGHGLSGGAIAGIVIGVIAAIIILLLICLCCCAKELIDGFLGLFGLGKKSRTRREETIIEERRSRRGGTRTWFGTRPGRSSRVSVNEKRGGGFGEWVGIAGLLGGLAVLLGMKRRHDRKDEKSDVSSAYYSYDSYSSPSSASSDRRSRRTDNRSRSRAGSRR